MRKVLFVNIFSIAIILSLATSCIPDENPVKPYDRGDAIKGMAEMGKNYSLQIYYSLDQNKVLKQNNFMDWDLGFSCAADRFEIILNFGKFMRAVNLGDVDFDTVSNASFLSIAEENWNFDNPFGKLDSTAIGKWWENEIGEVFSYNHVYIINRGLDERSKSIGGVKLQIFDFKDNTYSIKFGILKTGEVIEAKITKDPKYNYLQFSFDNGGEVKTLEPLKEEWDLLFTKYTELLYTDAGDEMWYGVTSALTNPFFVQSARLIRADFNSITSQILDTLSLSSYRNTVGHEWKAFNLESNSYVVFPDMVFIINGVSGFYYKLHFLEFYNDKGDKGYPLFEYQKL